MALWRRFRSIPELTNTVTSCISHAAIASSDSHVRVKRFYGIGNVSRVPPKVLEELQILGVTTIDCSQKQKNAADIVIVTEIMRSLMETTPDAICLISNDGGFSHCMTTVNHLGFPTLLLHDQPTRILAGCVTVAVNLTDHYKRQPPDDGDDDTVPLAVEMQKIRRQRENGKDGRHTVNSRLSRQKSPSPSPSPSHQTQYLPHHWYPYTPDYRYHYYKQSYMHDNVGSAVTVKRAVTTDRATKSSKSVKSFSSATTAGTNESISGPPLRPGLQHLMSVLDGAGGSLEYKDLVKQLGRMPRGWLGNLLHSGQLLRRLSVCEGRVSLLGDRQSSNTPRNQAGKAGA
jgi:hypothetical protein